MSDIASVKYFNNIEILKKELYYYNINFNKIIQLLNNKNNVAINNILQWTNIPYNRLIRIYNILNNIIYYRYMISDNLNNNLSNLDWLNKTLIRFNRNPQKSIKKARNMLKGVYINIYDLDNDNIYETDYASLRYDIMDNPERKFPLHAAKFCKLTKIFLISLSTFKNI